MPDKLFVGEDPQVYGMPDVRDRESAHQSFDVKNFTRDLVVGSSDRARNLSGKLHSRNVHVDVHGRRKSMSKCWDSI